MNAAHYIVNSMGWFGLGVYVQFFWERVMKEAPRERKQRKVLADR